MSWLLRATFGDGEELRRRVQLTRTGGGLLHVSPSLPLEPGQPFLLEARVASSGVQSWLTGTVRARGTGVVTLELPEVRQLLRPGRAPQVKLPPRRSPRFGAHLQVQLIGEGVSDASGMLVEISSDGARVMGGPGVAGRPVDLAVMVDGAPRPLARGRVRWRSREMAGLEFLRQPAGDPVLSRLLLVLSRRWSEALPLLAPGAPALSTFSTRPQMPLALDLASALVEPARAEKPASWRGNTSLDALAFDD
jgi:hypothetical protein